MKTQYFKCTLNTDIVVNASLATEGNMTTLNYIPGSNFLGIVAGKLYKDNSLTAEDKYNIFHSGKMSFGDALIANDDNVSYAVPFSLFQDKLKKDLAKEKTWVHHSLNGNRPTDDNSANIQLKQHRGGFLNKEGGFIEKVDKQFSLKSAHNREERRSKEGAMFGFESIKKGQEFIFSIVFEDEKYSDLVIEKLIGYKKTGKSKTAQYGQVFIEKINDITKVESNPSKTNQLVIYAESNLCFLNEFCQSTFQPGLSDFGLTNGSIDWNLSQIRTYSYSPWNGQRNTTNTQRDTIEKGSVIVVNLKDDVDINTLKTQVGEYTAEGLGRVIYNPEFLQANDKGIWTFNLNKKEENKEGKASIDIDNVKAETSIGKFLFKKLKEEKADLKIGKAVIKVIDSDRNILTHKDITKSQWGGIRTKAANAKNIDELVKILFSNLVVIEINEKLNNKSESEINKLLIDDKNKFIRDILKKASDKEGYLTHGIADEKIWGKMRGKRREELLKVILQNKDLGTKFVARLASDIAKLN